MCYNYSLIIYRNQRDFEKTYGVDQTQKNKMSSYYTINSFSLPKMPVISNENPYQFQICHWGLIPFWVKKIEDAEKIRNQTMNARAETLFEKPSYRNSIKQRRCLVPASGFFEWRYILGKNYPYYIRLKDKKWFSFAGIWDSWKNPETKENVYTYSIITCEPNNLLRKIHNKKNSPRDTQSLYRTRWPMNSMIHGVFGFFDVLLRNLSNSRPSIKYNTFSFGKRERISSRVK